MCFERSGDELLRCETEATKIAKAAAATAAQMYVNSAQCVSATREAQKVEDIAEQNQPENQFLCAATLFDACNKPALLFNNKI